MLFRILQSVVPPVARAIWRPIVVGRDNVPSSGGVLLASNHLSFADSVVIPARVSSRMSRHSLPWRIAAVSRPMGTDSQNAVDDQSPLAAK